MATCKKCGSPIVWIKTTRGWIPHNADDGAIHFEFCKKKLPADAPMMIRGKTITGENFSEVNCNCCPPWEVCEHSFPEHLVSS